MPDVTRFIPAPSSTLSHPAWTRSAALYQINTRQMTEEGTLRAAKAHLPRLAALGVRILWLMPIHEIGEANRKGLLGSPYAVRDYYSVNPDLGTMADLREFVAAAHDLGLKVILDWVANHTSWDNVLRDEHPDWYVRDWKGDNRPTPWWDWDDIIDLDYGVPELRAYMTGAMAHWVREADVDGFRCDVAGFVPTDFWETVRAELERIKPVFLLAEWEARDMHVAAFDATYAWSWNETLHKIAHGKEGLLGLHVYYSWNEKAYPRDAMRMTFVSNHDKNAFEGTEFEQFGDALEAAMVLSVVGEGIPMIYNGQESGFDKRLEFFDKDVVVFGEHPHGDLYRRLFALKDANGALHNGAWGARMIEVPTDAHEQVLAFVRELGVGDASVVDESSERHKGDRVFAAFNLADGARTVRFTDHVRDGVPMGLHHGAYRDFATGAEVVVGPGFEVEMPAWSYRVLVAGGGA